MRGVEPYSALEAMSGRPASPVGVVLVLSILLASCTSGTSNESLFEESKEQALPASVTDILSPSPRKHCGLFGMPASEFPPGRVHAAVRPYLPHYIPEGFGVCEAWKKKGSGGSPGIAWTAQRHRSILLALLLEVRGQIGGEGEARVGPWAVGVWHTDCYEPPAPDSRCVLDYRTNVPEGQLVLHTGGLSRRLADAIALSVPL
jgi:hypothetical protein